MQSKVLPLRSVAKLFGKAAYVADPNHANHVGKAIHATWIGCASELEFRLAAHRVRLGDGRIHRGRPVMNVGYEFEMRTPFQADLTAPERTLLERGIVETLKVRAARLAWHLEARRGCVDMHLVAVNADRDGRPLSRREFGNLLLRFRALMDRLHDQINCLRRAAKQPQITTMKDVRARQRTTWRRELLETLATAPVPLTSKGIVRFLKEREMLGKRCRITGDTEDYVTVLYGPDRRARREGFALLIRDARLERKTLERRRLVKAKAAELRLRSVSAQSSIP